MKALQQDEPNGKLFLREVPAPKPGPGEVLVRMARAPINPSDLGSLIGLSYTGTQTYPFIPGGEGSGTVVASGGGFMARLLEGRRVACAAARLGGTWAEYMVAPASHCIPLQRDVSFDQGAMLVVNPLTALAFVETAKKGKHRAIVNTVAASALGRMVQELAQREGIAVISIVRRAAQVDVVRSRGGEHVLDSGEPDFVSRLRGLAQQLGATLFLDAVGGELTAHLAAAAPYGTTILLYSRMSQQDSRVDPFNALVKNLTFQGWFLPNWLKTKNLFQALTLSRRAQRLIGTVLRTHVAQRVPLSSAQEALETYVASMTNQKVLLMMGDADL